MNLSAITGAFKAVGDVVDDLHTSEEEKLQLKNRFMELQTNAISTVIGYQEKLNAVQAQVITAEATGKSWLQRNWRPITMLTFLILIIFDTFGWTQFRLSTEAWGLLKIGLGGYVVGRSVEKVVQVGAQAVKDYKQ